MLPKTFVLGGLATLGSAHIIISNPVPFDRAHLNNSPLDKNGLDFPCKVAGDYTYDPQGASNVYQQGSTQQLEFVGSAVHGEGSCQVSVTTDLKPTKESVWKVIKSIEGGCPAKNQSGNLGTDAKARVPYKYDYTIPKEIAAGDYTMAWTWFNRIGEREMYMNCAPLTVTGSGGSSGFLDSLPDMHKANIGDVSKGCTNKEGKDLRFPDPGKDVDKFGEEGNLQDGTCPGGSGSKPATASQPSSPDSSRTAAATYPGKPTKPAKAGSCQSFVPGGIFMTVTSGGAGQTSTPTSAASGTASARPNTSSQSPPAPTNESGNETAPAGGYPAGTPCTSDGAWNCVGGNSFQRCASGTWSPLLDLAGGVSCNPGQSSEFKLRMVQVRRAMRRVFRL